MNTPAISFIIPLFNQLPATREMLTSLLCSLPADTVWELIFVDDGSSDGTREWLGSLTDSRIKVVLHESNQGYARSNNDGVRLAEGRILALLNNDLLFTPGWLQPMLAALESSSLGAGAVGNVQYRVVDGQLDHAGITMSAAAKLIHVQRLPGPERSRVPVRMLACTGACLLLRRSDYLDVGGFDEGYVNGAEDVDLCLKLAEQHKWTYLIPASRIRHHVSLSRNTASSQDERNSRRLYTTWRARLKAALVETWLGLLATGGEDCGGWIDGVLDSDFRRSPGIAARTIAEVMLEAEEAHWRRLFDKVDVNRDAAAAIEPSGLRFDESRKCHVMSGVAEFRFGGVHGARDFFVCGRLLPGVPASSVVLDLTVNGIQHTTFDVGLDGKREFNIGFVKPLLLSGQPNSIQLRVVSDGPEHDGYDETVPVVGITHLVLDDRLVRLP